MPINRLASDPTFALLDESACRPTSFITSGVVNTAIVAILVYIGMIAKHVIVPVRHLQITVIVPTMPASPPPTIRLKIPPVSMVDATRMPEAKMELPKIRIQPIEPKPDPKPLHMEANITIPIQEVRPSVVLAPQPKAALPPTEAAQSDLTRGSTAAVHFGEIFGVAPNSSAVRATTVAAIGSPSGQMNGQAAAMGIVGSARIGNSTRAGSDSGLPRRAVAPAAIQTFQTSRTVTPPTTAVPRATGLEVLSKPPVQYTSEARQLRVEGDVVLRVTFTAAGQVVIRGVIRGLGHGLDEEALRVARQIRFSPATENGLAVDMTTTITITFQLA